MGGHGEGPNRSFGGNMPTYEAGVGEGGLNLSKQVRNLILRNENETGSMPLNLEGAKSGAEERKRDGQHAPYPEKVKSGSQGRKRNRQHAP